MVFAELLALFDIRKLHHFEEAVHGSFSIDDDTTAVGEVDNHVRPQAAFIALRGFLLDEVAVIDHAGKFNCSSELDFSPGTAYVWPF